MRKRLPVKILKFTGLFLGLIISLFFVFFGLVYNGYFGQIPNETTIKTISNIEATLVYDNKGDILGKFYLQDRSPVTLDQVTPFLLKALVATEDKRFYQHNGIDFRSLIRVIVKSVLFQQSSAGGGSTISLQLAKNLFPRSSYRFLYYPINKTKEAIVAYRIEKNYSKEEILMLYLNTVSFGEDVYGVESAAMRYYNRHAANLAAHQAAALIGMLKATTSYSPVLHPDAALSRRNVVLLQMLRNEDISTIEYDSLCQLPLDTDYHAGNQELAAYFLAEVHKKLIAFIDAENENGEQSYNLHTDGLKVYTTLDAGMQRYAESAVTAKMNQLQILFEKQWFDYDLWSEYKSLLDREIKAIANGRKPNELQVKRKMIVLNKGEELEMEISPIDSLKHYLLQLQNGFLAVDPGSGAIKSWVGGGNYRFFPYDHVDYPAKRQVGSTFKPIVYAAALESGVNPCTYFKAEQEVYEIEDAKWQPTNDNARYDGKYSMEGALENSVNTVSVKILNEVGIDKTISLAAALGIESEIPPVQSIALGTASISLIEMVTAYASFVNGGVAIEPYMIERIEDKDGNILYKRSDMAKNRVISQRTAAVTTKLLEGVVNNGTARGLRSNYNLTNAIGGKTGTTQNNADGWFIAITPKLVVGSWVGGIYPEISFKETRLGQGATMALPIFGDFYRSLDRDKAYHRYTNAQFLPAEDSWLAALDCDPFKEDFNLFRKIFGKKNDKEESEVGEDEPQKDKGLFKKIGKLFKRN